MKLSFSIALRLLASAACLFLTVDLPSARAVFFDLHNLTPNSSTSYTLTVGGITAEVYSINRVGQFKSGASTFGVDVTSGNDDPALIDGGAGAESFAIAFSQNVMVESLLISQFDAIDHGTFNIKGAGTITLTNGVNDVGLAASSTSANFLTWTGDTATGGGRGFSLDGFTARLIGSGTGLLGDFDSNGRVDTRDYLTWRNGLGTSYTQNDYSTWRNHFGASTIGAGAATNASLVPEPVTTCLLGIGLVIATTIVRRRSTSHRGV